MRFNIVTQDMFLKFNSVLLIYFPSGKNHLLLLEHLFNMENAENKENNTTNHLNSPLPLPLPTTVELRTLCTQYVFAFTFHLDQVLKRVLS